MDSAVRKVGEITTAVLTAAVMALGGLLISTASYQTLRQWEAISPAFAACGVVWVVAGPALLIGALLVLISLGRLRLPIFIGGAAAAVGGGVLALGVATYVIPCAGPS